MDEHEPQEKSTRPAPKRRGPYKRYLSDPECPIPRQTLCNRRKNTAAQSDDSTGSLPAATSAASDVDDTTIHLHDDQFSGMSEDINFDPQKDLEEGICTSPPRNGATSIGAYTHTPTSVRPALLPSPAPLALYPGSCISEATGMLLL